MRTSLVAAVLLAAPSLAAAAPLATLSADVDGDGAPDAIAIASDGVLHVGSAAIPLGVTPLRATLAVGVVKGRPALVARVVSSTGGDEAVIVIRGAVAWRGVVDRGEDTEYKVELAASPTGIVRYQTRGDVRRCDGKPALLFAEDFDGTQFVRAPQVPIGVPPSAPLLTAKLDPTPPARRPVVYQARMASTRSGATDAGALAIPNELDDARADTAWRADAPAIGQFFTFTPRGEFPARQLRVQAGDQRSKEALAAANRPRELAIASAHGAWRVVLPDAATQPLGAAYVVDLPEPVSGCLTVILASTYGGAKDTAISELEVYADGERTGDGERMLAHAIATDASGAMTMAHELARGGASAAAAIDAELAVSTSASARRNLTRVLVDVHDAAAAPLLVRAATSGWVEGRELVAVVGALGALHQAAELRALVAQPDLATDERVAAAAALDPGSPDGLAALIAVAGTGPREVRRQVIERLQSAPSAALIAAAATQTTPAAAGDLWRAATRAARARAGERPAVLAAMTAALPGAQDYERRARLVDGIAALGDAPALAALEATLEALPKGESQTAALRQMAARALAKSPRGEALRLVVALASDPDPGVRLAALTTLMQAGDDASGTWHGAPVDKLIGERLARDSWGDVRIRAAQALGGRCARAEPAAALATAVRKDAAEDVRTESLVALVQCKAAGIAELLAHTWNDDKAPLALRTRAIGLAIALGDRALGAKLVGELATWRGAAIESKPALALAASAANAIGKLDAPGADAALQDALGDAAFPEIVGAAASGLGSLGPSCSTASKAKLETLAHDDEPQIAVPARHAAAACGAARRP